MSNTRELRLIIRYATKLAGWDKLPKGWTQDSLDKFWKSVTKENPDHPVSACIEKMKGKLDSPEAFCAGAKDEVTGDTYWRGEKKKAGLDMMKVADLEMFISGDRTAQINLNKALSRGGDADTIFNMVVNPAAEKLAKQQQFAIPYNVRYQVAENLSLF